MDWNTATLDYIYQHPYLADWPDGRLVLDAVKESIRAYALTALPTLVCQTAGGDARRSVPLSAAYTLLNWASNVLDDYQDQDTANPWTRWPLQRVLAATLAMTFLAQSCLARLDAEPDTKQEILDSYAQVGILAAVGQNVTPTNAQRRADYWRHVIGKSSVIHSVACWSGARMAGDDAELLQAAKEFGLALGTLLQIVDDCQGVWAAAEGRSTESPAASLPVIMALERRGHPSAADLADLLEQGDARGRAVWVRAVGMLAIEMGGTTDALAVGKVYEQKALAALSILDPSLSSPLADYVRATYRLTES